MASKEHQKELEKLEYHLGPSEKTAAGKGCVTKCVGSEWKDSHGSYRKNGYDETLSKPKKKAGLYNKNFTLKCNKKYLPKKLPLEVMKGMKKGSTRNPLDPTDNPTAWHIGVGENFKKGYLPYNHDYHHILPKDALMSLSPRELKALMKSGYNLNDGDNMIILPCHKAIAAAFPLPYHASNHPQYIQSVKGIIARVKGKAEPKVEDHKITQANADSVRDLLVNWQKDEFKALIGYAKRARATDGDADVDNAKIAKV